MKRVLILAVPIAAVIVLAVLLASERDGSNTIIVDDQLATSVPLDADPDLGDPEVGDPEVGDPGATSDSSAASDPRAASDPDVPADARLAEIIRLADGDSFDIRWLDTDESDEVRLLGINAPESNACFGDAARGVLQVLTDRAEVQVQETERDEFGRAISNVWADGAFVNVTMVRLGAALALSDQGEHAALIRQAQEDASAGQAGLWDPVFCGVADDVDLAIADIQADAPGQDNLNPNGEWIDIVNLASVDADLTGWSIRDESTRHRFGFPTGFVLEADGAVRVFSGCGDDTADELYWCDGDPVWNNRGDTGFLVDPDGAFADTLSYSG